MIFGVQHREQTWL